MGAGENLGANGGENVGSRGRIIAPPADSGFTNPTAVAGVTYVQDFGAMADGYIPLHSNGDNYYGKPATQVDSSQETVSGKSLKSDIYAGCAASATDPGSGAIFGELPVILTLEVGDSFWFRLRVKLQSGFIFSDIFCDPENPTNKHKFLRHQLWTGSSLVNRMTMHMESNNLDVTGSVNEPVWNEAHDERNSAINDVNHRNNISGDFNDNQYHTIEWYTKFSATNSEAGDMKVWVDGVRKFTSVFVSGAPLLEASGNSVKMMVFDYINGGISQNENFWIGDVVYSTNPPNTDSFDSFQFIGV